uniref:G-patch domain-containing protein n=1 Tax=Plectus sambesii TaxID=2011161 RepID=A0A914XFM3_9BILA
MPKQLAIFGTNFEDLDDEERDSVSKKPLAVQDQVATDEKGRRRFHGAFTGGFSAGYFNTVGTKHGWVPQTFKSTRDERAEKLSIRAEDFMDDEDMGEFGIAPRQIRTARDFVDELGLSVTGEKRRLAWEHSAGTSGLSAEASRLADLIRPVSDSIGMRLLKKMGWRPGQGIGPKMSKRFIERQKANEQKVRRDRDVDESVIAEADEMAPGFEFAPEDVDPHYFVHKSDVRGLGYEGLEASAVLQQGYGVKTAALKSDNKKGKGITGQAFGVGVFEAEDGDIYSTDDLSQYDYSLGESSSSYNEKKIETDTDFTLAKSVQGSRKHFPPPKLPSDFAPQHRPLVTPVKQMPATIRKIGERLTPVERARLLGEGDVSVMSLLRDEDRRRLERTRSRWEPIEEEPQSRGRSESHHKQEKQPTLPFADNPTKQARYKEYVSYLKRGLNYPQPVDTTEWEWERELTEFQEQLTPELRAVLPEVKARQRPLANPAIATPFAHLLKSKFTTAAGADDEAPKTGAQDEDKLQAVRMKMFGSMTRERHEWHPSAQLVKRFNIPNPYPESNVEGVPHFQKDVKKESIYDLSFFPSTAQDVANRRAVDERIAAAGAPLTAADTPSGSKTEPIDVDDKIKQEKVAPAESAEPERPPVDLFKAIFASDDEDDNKSDSSDAEDATSNADELKEGVGSALGRILESAEAPSSSAARPAERIKREVEEPVLTVMDLIPSTSPPPSNKRTVDPNEDPYGPALPPRADSPTLPLYSVIAENKKRSRRHKEKKSKKKLKKSSKSKHKKGKKPKKEKRKHRSKKESESDSESSSSDSSVRVID